MPRHAAALVAAGLYFLPMVQGVGTVVSAVAGYVVRYQHEFGYLLADEETRQEVRRAGRLLESRTTRGELFTTFVDQEGVWMSVRDVHDVDGRPVSDRPDLRELLKLDPFARVAPRLASANARHNIGRVTRNFNEPTLALLIFTPRYRPSVRFDIDGNQGASPATTRTIRFAGRDGFSLVRSWRGPVNMRGTASVNTTTGLVASTMIEFEQADVRATLRTTYAAAPTLAMWVPVSFEETYVSRDDETTSANSTYGNYRRFDVVGRVLAP